MGPLRPLRSTRRWPIAAGLILLSVVGAPLAALAEWPQFQGDAAHLGVSDGPSAPLQVAWTNDDVGVEDAERSFGLSPPVVAEDGTIVTVGPRAVFAFEPEEGAERFSIERDLGPSTQPAIADGPDGPIVVYTEGYGDSAPAATGTPSPTPSPEATDGDDAFDSHVNAVALESGEPVWAERVQLEAVVQAPVATDGTTAYVGDVDGTVTAIALDTGAVRWTADVGSPVIGAVTVVDDVAYVSALGPQQGPGSVVALDAASGGQVWRTGGDVTLQNLVSAPAVADGRLFVLEPGFLVAVDAADAGLLWRREVVDAWGAAFGRQIVGTQSPVVADDQVFAVDVTGRVFAFDARSGVTEWDHALNDTSSLSTFLVTPEHVLVTTDAGVVHAIDRGTGHLRSSLDVGGSFVRGLADAGEVLVAVDGVEDARVLALAPDPDGVLVDEPSPTTVGVGRMLAGFALGGLGVAAIVVLLARPLQRRLGPPAGTDAGPDGDAEGVG